MSRVMNVVARIFGGKPFAADDAAEWRSGWRLVLGSAVGLGTGIPLYLLVASLFIEPLNVEFGWTRGDMGIAGMVAFVTGAVTLPIIGRSLDRFGFHPVVLVCVPALAAVYLGIAMQPGSYAIYLGLMVCGGLFGGGTGSVAYTRPLVSAFHRQRGLALGVATAGQSLCAIVAPLVLGTVIADHGWRAGLVALAFITLGGMPIALALIGRRREARPGGPDDLAENPTSALPNATLGQAIRSNRFWLIALALIAVNIPGSGVAGQLAPLIGDKGFTGEAAALVMSVYAAGLLGGRILVGILLDLRPAGYVGAFITLVSAIGTALLTIPEPTYAIAAIAVVMIGLQQGSEIDLLAYLISRSFGVLHYGAIYGAISTAGALSTAVALVFFGKVHDWTNSYHIALVVGAASFCVGAACLAATSRTVSPAQA